MEIMLVLVKYGNAYLGLQALTADNGTCYIICLELNRSQRSQ